MITSYSFQYTVNPDTGLRTGFRLTLPDNSILSSTVIDKPFKFRFEQKEYLLFTDHFSSIFTTERIFCLDNELLFFLLPNLNVCDCHTN